MIARNYRVKLDISPFDFRPEKGIGESSLSYQSEPFLINDKVVLKITKSYILTDMFTNNGHEVLKVQSVYEIPPNEIKSREDVYEFYKDATLSLNESFQAYKYELLPQSAALPNIVFPIVPIENYKVEIDRVFNLLNSRN
ncbi:MAG TPA: hypothetical protein VMZ03_09665 [Chitinophagaceae bacterium]|nr:hypothetical protein [Chitinophagaceae bacterium]